MNQPARHLWRVVVLSAIIVGPVASGAEDEDDPVVEVKKNDIVIQDSNFDRWVFQVNQGRGVQKGIVNAAAGRARIESQLKVMLNELVQACHPNEDQLRKLTLAARGDMRRFFDQVEEVRGKYLAVKDDQNRLNEVWSEIRSLQLQFSQGLFGDKSLFAKMLRKTLTEEQLTKYQTAMLDKRREGYREAIETWLPKLGNGIVLRLNQHEALQKLLLEETQPPLLFGQFDQQVVTFRLSQLPPAKLKEVLDKSQWKQLQPLLLQAGGTEDNLTQFGVIEERPTNAPVIVRSVRTVVEGPTTTPTATEK